MGLRFHIQLQGYGEAMTCVPDIIWCKAAVKYTVIMKSLALGTKHTLSIPDIFSPSGRVTPQSITLNFLDANFER